MRKRHARGLAGPLLCGLLLIGAAAAQAAAGERGFPLIQSYEPNLPEAGIQNFAIATDPPASDRKT